MAAKGHEPTVVGGRRRTELQPNVVYNAETQRELMAAQPSESSHFSQKGHARKATLPPGKDATIIPDETTFDPLYS